MSDDNAQNHFLPGAVGGPPIDAEAVRRLAALNGLLLDADRAEALVPFLQGLLEADARLAALDLRTLPAAGLPWEPFADQLKKEGESGHGG
jgi:hypothetical protein